MRYTVLEHITKGWRCISKDHNKVPQNDLSFWLAERGAVSVSILVVVVPLLPLYELPMRYIQHDSTVAIHDERRNRRPQYNGRASSSVPSNPHSSHLQLIPNSLIWDACRLFGMLRRLEVRSHFFALNCSWQIVRANNWRDPWLYCLQRKRTGNSVQHCMAGNWYHFVLMSAIQTHNEVRIREIDAMDRVARLIPSSRMRSWKNTAISERAIWQTAAVGKRI
jgi:hypothetical protein